MRLFLSLVSACAILGPASAAPPDPLRLLPDDTPLVLKVDNPRLLVESLLDHDLAKEAQSLEIVRDFLDSADARGVFRLIAHFEKELGAPWPELLDRLAGGGMAAGLKLGDNAPAVLVMQGTDEKSVARFFDLSLGLFEEELTRQGVKEMPARRKYAGVEVVQFSQELLAARIGAALVLSNRDDSMKAALDRHEAGVKAKGVVETRAPAEAGKLLPKSPLAWLWVNLKPVKELPEAKDLFASPRDNVILTFLFAGYLDVARRSDFVAAGLYHDRGDFRLAIRMPAGRDGMAPDVALHLPTDPKVVGSLPLLEPPGVLFTHSFYLDLDTLYRQREAVLPPQVAKDFAEGEKNISRFLLGTTLPEYLRNLGVHYRLVAVKPEKVESYKTQPDQRLPAFGVVVSMRDPKFAKTTTALIRAGALALSEQATLRSWEEEIAGVPAFGYSFPEKGKFPDDPLKARFNYQPTFGVVQDQFIAASNKGLFKNLAELVRQEDRTKPESRNMQMRGHASGISDFVYSSPEATLAGTILGQGLKLGEARRQTEALLAYLHKLGTVSLETDYTATQFRFDLTWKTSAK